MNIPQNKLISTSAALEFIKSGDTVVTAMAAAEPKLFMTGIAKRALQLENVKVWCANPSEEYDCFKNDQNLEGRLELLVMFLTSKVRKLQGFNRVHYIPQNLSAWSRNILHRGDVDVFWGSCSKPDKRGFISLGTGCCYESDIFRKAKLRIMEVNPNMPMTFGSTTMPTDDVDYFIETDHPLPQTIESPTSENDEKIGRFIADLIEDGSTLQLGIGSIPNAVGKCLRGKKDIGIHTEMINDAMMEMCKQGIITGKKKTTWPGKLVGSFAYGTKELYEFLDQNPMIELHPAAVVNDPYRIGKNHKMVSCNTAVEVDLTGQVCSESIGHKELSGVGGASETHIGAQRSPGGRGIVALHAVTKRGQSKIVFELMPGAKVSISRNNIDTVVTEYGVAELRGRSVSERVRAMASLAAPEFREELLANAQAAGYL